MTIVDTNVLLDILDKESRWVEWSTAALDEASRRGALIINAVICAEIAPWFESPAALESFMVASRLKLDLFTHETLYRAGVAHRRYRRAGGARERVLPDFLIGAHAAVSGLPILTRDPRPYRTCFPTVRLITPE